MKRYLVSTGSSAVGGPDDVEIQLSRELQVEILRRMMQRGPQMGGIAERRHDQCLRRQAVGASRSNRLWSGERLSPLEVLPRQQKRK
jgi:hypothetical protein